MKDNRLLKVLWGIVLAIFLCSALFLAISYFSGGDNASKKKDNNTTSTSKSKDKEKEDNEDSKSSTSKAKSDEEKYRESQNSNNSNSSANRSSNNNATSNNRRANNSNNNNSSDKKDDKDTSPATPGTFKTSEEAKKYADAEIARLIKENKKGYSYTLGRNSKGEITVNITEKK